MDRDFCLIEIRRNKTDQRVVYRHEFKWGGEFMWADGNYSCDCNRALFFEKAGGPEIDDDEFECGENSFTIMNIKTPDGNTVYSEA